MTEYGMFALLGGGDADGTVHVAWAELATGGDLVPVEPCWCAELHAFFCGLVFSKKWGIEWQRVRWHLALDDSAAPIQALMEPNAVVEGPRFCEDERYARQDAVGLLFCEAEGLDGQSLTVAWDGTGDECATIDVKGLMDWRERVTAVVRSLARFAVAAEGGERELIHWYIGRVSWRSLPGCRWIKEVGVDLGQ